MPIGLGEPCFDKLEAKMAHGMLSLPATKGFEFGSGFDGCAMRGSQHNDQFKPTASGGGGGGVSRLRTTTNFAGGTLGGISNGEDMYFRVAVKPVSTIGQAQQTSTYDGQAAGLEAKGRHDPCVLVRIVITYITVDRPPRPFLFRMRSLRLYDAFEDNP